MTTYKVIQHQEVGAGGAASITFSNIPQIYTDLLVVTSLRDDTANAGWANAYIYPNGSSANMSSKFLFGWSTNVGTSTASSTYHELVRGASTANTFSNSSIYIPNYTSSAYKSISIDTSTERNDVAALNAITAALWSSNDAITSLQIVPEAGNFTQYSSATLYGIRKYNTSLSPKATGGIISYVDGYWVHTFIASGTFTATQSLSVDALVVAGGGGGGMNDGAGGGGGGGYLYNQGVAISSGSYSITIGSGGVGSTTSGTDGTKGGNTTFGVLFTAEGGGYGARGYPSNGAVGGNGGSGGGGGIGTGNTGNLAGGTATSGQGNNGGASIYLAMGGGGGGAGSAGAQGGGSTSGKGGDAALNSISGTGVYYAAGAAGGIWYDQGKRSAAASLGGVEAGYDGGANRGAGGGGGGNYVPVGDAYGGNGGSGIVIVRYSA